MGMTQMRVKLKCEKTWKALESLSVGADSEKWVNIYEKDQEIKSFKAYQI